MTTSHAARWFYTQPMTSLGNTLTRNYLAELLTDPVNALTIIQERQPLRWANASQVNRLLALTTANTELLARLPIDWGNALERGYLPGIIAALNPQTIYNNVVASIAQSAPLLLWYRMNEAATPAVNYGSVASVNGTVANMGGFQAATGLTAIPLSYDFNGTTSIVTVPIAAGLASADYTLACLVNPDNAGEGSSGALFDLRTSAGVQIFTAYFFGTVDVIGFVVRNQAGTPFTTATLTGISAGAWTWVFIQFNSATAKIRGWKSVVGVLTEFGYSQQPALTGTQIQIERGTIGAMANGSQTWDGKYTQPMLFGSLLTTVQMQAIITRSGV